MDRLLLFFMRYSRLFRKLRQLTLSILIGDFTMKRLQFILLTCLLGWTAIGTAGGRNFHNNFSISDFATVSEAVDAIKATLENQGMEIVGVIDHAANAKTVNLELLPTQLILFRDRRLEKRLLRRSPTVGIDLPQKILVWEGPANGKIKLLYNAAGYLSDRHSIKSRDRLLSHLNKRLNQFGQLENGLITVDSEHSVEETVEKLKMTLLNNGFLIPFTFDFKKHSHSGQSQLIIFGNPNVGTPLMQNQPSIGLDLPQKFLVWEDRKGQVHITYNDPLFLAKRHGVQGLDIMLDLIAKRLEQLANGTTSENTVTKKINNILSTASTQTVNEYCTMFYSGGTELHSCISYGNDCILWRDVYSEPVVLSFVPECAQYF
jgi:uncharacterized protein (DUF302 family)